MTNIFTVREASSKAIYPVSGLLVLISVKLLQLPLTTMAFSLEHIQSGEGGTVNGKVVAEEHNYLTALVPRSRGIGRFPNDHEDLY